MKSRLIKLGITAVALLLGQQAFARQNAVVADATGEMLCVEVFASATTFPALPRIAVEDKAALQARIKQDSLKALKQAANPVLLQQQSRQELMLNGMRLQASL